jgi:hypothetical protein
MTREFSASLFLAVVLLASPAVQAQDCAGFTDVAFNNRFCPNVEWVKNRSITLGCASTSLYCPGDPVTRLSMAAFMNRLGRALTPQVVFEEASAGFLDLDQPKVLCATAELPIDDYPRTMHGNFSVSAVSNDPLTWEASLAQGVGGGAWFPGLVHRYSKLAGGWTHLSGQRRVALNPGTSVRYGILVSRANNSVSGDFAAFACQLTVVLNNRNGTSSPFDAETLARQ